MADSKTGLSAEIVAVGSELLLGDNVDTNSAWLSQRLAEIGVDVHRHTTVGDNPSRMAQALGAAADRADIVIVTGGLGPTQDDVTRDVVADLAGVGLERRAELVEYLQAHFARRGRTMTSNNLRQADVPVGGRVLSPVGSAAGFAIDLAGATVYCLPGVPWEMEAIFNQQIAADLVARGGVSTTVSRLVRTAGMGESTVAEICAGMVERLDEAGNPTIAFLASKGETRVRVTGKAANREDALALVDPVVEELVALLGAAVAGVDDEGVEHAVARQLRSAGWTLAVAESVTGGAVGARLVAVLGAGDWFRGGVIVYATDAKRTVAGIDAALLERHGPVSEEVAEALAVRAQAVLGADVGLAVVGVAGPTTQNGKPVGTVCVGVALPDGTSRARTVQMAARDRQVVQEFAASVALDGLRRRLAEAARPA